MDARDRRRLRLEVARRDAPVVLRWMLIVYAGLTALNSLGGTNDATDLMVDLVVLAIMGLALLLVRGGRVGPRAIPWIVACVLVSISLGLALQFTLSQATPSASYGQQLLVMVAAASLILDWAPTLVASVGFLGSFLVYAGSWTGAEASVWRSVTVGAIGIGLVLMRIRMRALDELAASNARLREMASRDSLTGLLNRRGLHDHLPRLLRQAHERGLPVHALFVDIDGLKAANDRHGHDFGDEVIRAVAVAIEGCARDGDVIARWGGDEFILVGGGALTSTDLFERNLRSALQRSTIDPARWPHSVSIGLAQSVATTDAVADLLARADAAMYARRERERRG